jgi:hypothetical protein
MLLLASALLMEQGLQAHVNFGINCAGCHTTARNAMDLVDFQRTLDLGLGDGPLKVYTVQAGQTVAIGINVINGANQFAVNFNTPSPATGITNASNQLTYTPDAGWTQQSQNGIYYTFGPSTWNNATVKRTFNLTVNPSTPSDLYRAEILTAGVQSSRWSEREKIYIEVQGTAVTNQPPVITAPTVVANHFACSVSTSPGVVYSLEFRPAVEQGIWITVGQVTGDGTVQVITDAYPAGTQGFYRLRAE